MSTNYYKLIDGLEIKKFTKNDDESIVLTLMYDYTDELVGSITISSDDFLTSLLIGLCDKSYPAPMRTHYGGSAAGTLVTINDYTLPDDYILVSECCELLTVAEIKSKEDKKCSWRYEVQT